MRMSSLSVSSFAVHILLLSCVLFTPTQSSDGSENEDLIDQICKKTPFYDLCSSILHSNPSTPKDDPKGMALIMVNDILANATDTLSYIEELIKQTTDRQLEQQLAFCAESYVPIVKYILPQAADAIRQGQFGFASYNIFYAEKEVTSCDKKFSGSTQSPISDRNSIMQKLVDVAAAIVKLLLNG
ncbi:cell wall / vacuolar inhibitor of fructosidase 1-like [Abrus precatorius]|uniref:Cell wall / vacuolar inhibitor of fructosidase 1-like n=1 Tax=Abrus precatorius TaxID=3816 RepID=A0A8B8JR25_ABRPR|nr:cell wall / vacuolar inhibitor of fructosidase 1-like [Abrus precatorius]